MPHTNLNVRWKTLPPIITKTNKTKKRYNYNGLRTMSLSRRLTCYLSQYPAIYSHITHFHNVPRPNTTTLHYSNKKILQVMKAIPSKRITFPR